MASPSKRLFREEAKDSLRTKWLGNIILVRPFSFRVMTAFSAGAALLVIAFLLIGTYTKRATVAGTLEPESGLVKVYAPRAGVVLEKHVQEGQHVSQGDVLFVISSENRTADGGTVEAAITHQVKMRRTLLGEEYVKTRKLQQEERESQTQRISALESEVAKLGDLINAQSERVRLAEGAFSRYQGLLTQDYLSREQVEQKHQELIEQRIRLQSLERDRIGARRDLSLQRQALSESVLKQQNQLSQINRSLATAEQEFTEVESRRRAVITAPEAGTITASSVEIGQTADTTRPLLNIVPYHATLVASLFAPSRAVGFIRAGDQALLRFEAYPYQKFGHYRGTVAQVSKTSVPRGEIANLTNARAPSNDESFYLIKVTLDAQTVHAYGRDVPLQAGMNLSADLLQDRRHLYEWVLEPLISLTGKL